MSAALWHPHAYQRQAIKFLLEHGAAGLFLDPGLGKTAIALGAFTILKRDALAERMLVVAPLRPAQLVWPAEIAKWAQFNALRCVVLHGKDKREEHLRPGKFDVYVINYEGLDWLARQRGLDSFFAVLCLDESTKIKHTRTQRFKTLRNLLDRFARRWILTGTPAPNGLLDLFGQIFALDQGHALGRFITHYKAAYFMPTGYGGYQWTPMRDAPRKIYERLAPLVLRMSEQDYLKLPPLTVPAPIVVELPRAARRAYDQLERDLFARLDAGEVTAVNAAVALMKCRQVANGGVYVDLEGEDDVKTRRVEHLHDAKTEAVKDLVDELSGQPVLIAYEFAHDLARLRKALGANVPHIGGGINGKALREIERAWNAGEIDKLLVQPQSAAHGLNLQAGGRALIWHSLTYSWEDYDQLVRRVYRQGQTQRVFVYRIVARDTVDEPIIAALNAKRRGQQALFDALTRYRGKRRPGTP